MIVELKYKCYYLSITSMLHQKSKIVNRRRISQSEIRNSVAAEKRGRAKIPPPHPPSFLPARASGFVSVARSATISQRSVQKMFERSRIIPPISNFQIFPRLIRRRNAPPHTAKWGFRALRARPSGGPKSLAILSIYFAQLKTNNINL